MKNLKKIVLALTVTAVLSGCSSTNALHDEAEAALKAKVESDLMTSINNISKSLDRLETIERGTKGITNTKTAIGNTVAGRVVAKAGEVKNITKDTKAKVAENYKTALKVDTKKVDAQSSKGKEVVLSKLDQKLNMKWSGDASVLLKKLNNQIGFTYKEEGNKTKLPVNITAQNKTIKEVFGLIDSQTNSKADIKISTINRTVSLLYK